MKRYFIVLGVIAFIFICFIVFYQYKENNDHGMKAKVNTLMGHSVFGIWSTYNEIVNNNSELTNDNLEDIYFKLSVMEGYSLTVDKVTETHLMVPITNSMISISKKLIENFEKQQSFTENDQEQYSDLLQYVNKMYSLIMLYYIPNSEGKVSLTISQTNKNEIKIVRDELKEYTNK